MMQGFCEKQGLLYQLHYPLREHTTFRIGGNADIAVFPKNEEEASLLARFLQEKRISFFVLGKGSDVLADDAGYRGVLIATEQMNRLECRGNQIVAGAGCSMASVSNLALKHSLSGFEFLHGIPGSVGGGVYMNAGAYGGEMASIVRSVRWVDLLTGEIREEDQDKLEFAYRSSYFTSHPSVICSVTLEGVPGDPATVSALMKDLDQRRRNKQPLEFPSAGSTFKRPEGHFAGQLIEASGLKGYRVGGAEVSMKHAGFVINIDHATSEDVRRIISDVAERVYRDSGVRLEPEICFLESK